MCCERLQESAINTAANLDVENPLRKELSKIAVDLYGECPAQRRSHTAKLAGTPFPPESVVIPNFLRKHPEYADVLEEAGALEPLLR